MLDPSCAERLQIDAEAFQFPAGRAPQKLTTDFVSGFGIAFHDDDRSTGPSQMRRRRGTRQPAADNEDLCCSVNHRLCVVRHPSERGTTTKS